ncbi:MAG TPA: 30S ribosomal protein S13 [Nitrososphaera sp.]|nr:30S ribosomal protein S13 [Nitrososphaera sp.]
MLSASEYKHILRIAGKDIEGAKKVIVAVSEIKGVGYNFAQVLTQTLNINPNKRVGFLTEEELRQIEQAIANPAKAGVPQWYLNRRKSMDDGSAHHIITSDLDFANTNDVEREKLVMSWRGYRHMFGLRVRGQRTRTTGRKGGAVGVKKVALRPGQVPGAAGAPGAAAPAAGAAAAPAAAGKEGAKPAAGAAPAAGAKPAAGAPPAGGAKPAAPTKEPAKK